MNKSLYRTGAVLLGLAMAATGYAADAPQGAFKPVVAVAKVGTAADARVRHYPGLLISPAQVNLVTRVSGDLQKVGFTEGSEVKQGQLLYQLDPVRHEAAVKSAQAKIAEIEAKLTYAQNSYERNNDLYNKQAVSLDTMESTESVLKAFQAAYLEAQAALITAEDDLKNTKITAPITGRIGTTNFTAGNYITPSSGVLATIVQSDPLRVSFSISTKDFLTIFGSEANLRKNAKIALKRADDCVYAHEATVEFLDNEADKRTDTVQIFALVPNPERELLPGNTVTVMLSNKAGAVLPAIPPSAVMHDSRSAFVYVLSDADQVERRDVVLGNVIDRNQLIRSGLQPGESVIVDGTHKVTPGSSVIRQEVK